MYTFSRGYSYYIMAMVMVVIAAVQARAVCETGRAGPALTSLGPACGLYIKPGRPPLARAFQERSLDGPVALAGRVIGCDSRLWVAHTH
jgi:hypothetical protein